MPLELEPFAYGSSHGLRPATYREVRQGLICSWKSTAELAIRFDLSIATLLKYLHAFARDGHAQREPSLNGYLWRRR
jgi:hypothetical protein